MEPPPPCGSQGGRSGCVPPPPIYTGSVPRVSRVGRSRGRAALRAPQVLSNCPRHFPVNVRAQPTGTTTFPHENEKKPEPRSAGYIGHAAAPVGSAGLTCDLIRMRSDTYIVRPVDVVHSLYTLCVVGRHCTHFVHCDCNNVPYGNCGVFVVSFRMPVDIHGCTLNACCQFHICAGCFLLGLGTLPMGWLLLILGALWMVAVNSGCALGSCW